MLPFRFSKIGTWWGPYRDGEERKTAEIDIVALTTGLKRSCSLSASGRIKLTQK